MEPSIKNDGYSELKELIQKLEHRISRIEDVLKFTPSASDLTVEKSIPDGIIETDEEREEKLELRIGQSWFALLGTTVLIIGFCFMLSLPYENFSAYLPGTIGYFLTVAIFSLSSYLRATSKNISSFLLGGGMILLYFSTLRFYFFGAVDAIQSNTIEILLLSIIVLANILISLKRDSFYLVCISLTLGLITVLISTGALYLYVIVTLISIAGILIRNKYKWGNVVSYLMPLAYLTHVLWYLIYARDVNIYENGISIPLNLLFILVYASIFSSAHLKREEPFPETLNAGLFTFFNSAFAFVSILLIQLTSKYEPALPVYLSAFLFFMLAAMLFWIKEKSKYSTFYLAMAGYLSLSLAILHWQVPDYLIWLCWQSLLVVVTAVWFRSKFIVVTNFIIYLAVLLAYLTSGEEINFFSLSFGVTALLSARILNWKKERLELQTEQMRNAYLAAALFTIPYALYNTVPESLISISWIIVAVIYYLLSIVLNNKKYRWMSLITFLLTLVYTAIIGITGSDLVYKIVSFLALGIVLITISVLYTKRKIKDTHSGTHRL
ncbi:MAG: DUF2339 domain-containing protein [Ignavibacteriales bacterium]|nr:DUF2339 domain-containing protein [Ignavibacteriales bacterium]